RGCAEKSDIASFCATLRLGILRTEKDFEHALRRRAAHSVDAFRQRIFLANQAINVDRFVFQQIERRLETPAPRSDDRNLVNYNRRGVEFGFPMKCRLQHELTTRTQQFECEAEARRRSGRLNHDIEFALPFSGDFWAR